MIISKAFRIMTIGVPSYKKSQVFRFFLLDEETSAVRTPQFGVSEARFDVRGVTMLLIDQKGSRVRPVCRECRKVHAGSACPRRRLSPQAARTRRVMEAIRLAKRAVGQ